MERLSIWSSGYDHSDSDYTFLVLFPAGVTGHGYVWKTLWPM